MHSLWEKQSFLSADIIVVGAGITGLSAAASLKELDPSLKVIVLEKGILPTGASTKNAGFACFGSASELIKDIEFFDEDGMIGLVEKRWNGLQKTCQRLGKGIIDLQIKSGYELIFESSSSTVRQLDRINTLLHPLFNKPVFQYSNEKIDAYGFGETNHLIENSFEGQLDTGKLISSLWDYCNHLGVKVHTGCNVMDIYEDDKSVTVSCEGTIFKSDKVAICTNAFTAQLLPHEKLDMTPGRGMIISIMPEQPLLFEGTFHYHEGYYYFRDYYGKLLFGGGRNLALQEEETTEFGINEFIKEKLIEDIEKIILPNQKYKIETEWSGIMAFGSTKSPIVKKISNRVAISVRLGGMGVAIGSLVGEEVAELLIYSQ